MSERVEATAPVRLYFFIDVACRLFLSRRIVYATHNHLYFLLAELNVAEDPQRTLS